MENSIMEFDSDEYEEVGSDQYLCSFLKRLVPSKILLKERKNGIRFKTINLHNSITNKKSQVKKVKNGLSSKQRKQLKLLTFKESEKNYQLYLPLSYLWIEYMKNVLKKLHFSSPEYNIRVLKADLHGCTIKVNKSKCCSLVGLEGIILLETKNVFTVITKENQIKKLPKRNTVFTFEFDNKLFTIYGNNFRFKASERSVRSFKTQPSFEL